MLSNKLFSSIGNTDRLYVDDVFSAYTYTGKGSTQTINNGIDLAGHGGMVWLKSRSTSYGHQLFDTSRGVQNQLSTNSTGQPTNVAAVTAFNPSGFSLGGQGAGVDFISWTFRNAPRFYGHQVVTKLSGSNRTVNFPELVTLGMVRVKRTDKSGSWYVWHRSLSAGQLLIGETTNVAETLGHITVSGTAVTLVNGVIANGIYLVEAWAHDEVLDGIVRCGSFTTNVSGIASEANLGWEPQYMLFKRTDSPSSWTVLDSMRGFARNGTKILYAESYFSEGPAGVDTNYPTATGARLSDSANGTYIYLAIRRPNKPPTTGTQVYKSLTHIGTGSVGSTTAVGFSPDLAISQSISGGRAPAWVDRLRGVKQWLRSDAPSAEGTQTTSGLSSFDMLGVSYTADNTEQPYAWNSPGEAKHQRFFRRAPGFMDVVCSQSTPSGDLSFSHGLGVVPELIIHTDRGYATDWDVWTTAFGGKHYLKLNFTSAATSVLHPSTLTATTVFSGIGSQTSNSPQVCYLFASLPGISKVGSYTGNGSSQTINCGFSTGARFILIKRTDSTGDWYVWDTARGIIAANDPHLSLNISSAEVTTNDSVDPDSTGFIVNQVAATNINVTSSTYLYLAIA